VRSLILLFSRFPERRRDKPATMLNPERNVKVAQPHWNSLPDPRTLLQPIFTVLLHNPGLVNGVRSLAGVRARRAVVEWK
jgi:hypothetical protein